MIMSIHDLAEEEMKERDEPSSEPKTGIHTIQDLQPQVGTFHRSYTGIPVKPTTNPNTPKYEMKITLFNKGFERDMM